MPESLPEGVRLYTGALDIRVFECDGNADEQEQIPVALSAFHCIPVRSTSAFCAAPNLAA